jgi:RHS repeat-associated protein
VTYAYDKASRRTTLIAGSQTPITYGYDVGDRLKTITQGSEITSFIYDTVDRRTRLTLPNGVRTNTGYDTADQITALTYLKADGSALGDLKYAYDPAGRRTKVTGSFAPQSLPSATTSDYQYNANNQLIGGNGQAPQYDANGDPTTNGLGTQYTFDARHRLIQISQGVVITASFQYDAFDRRVSKTDANGVTTAYLYDGSDAIQETSGGTIRTSLTGQNIDERFARDDASGRTYFLTDALGSTIALTDAAANIQQRYDYEPYGEVNATGAAGLSNPYQYTGRENDGNGLYYYRARYYNPVTKRFISEDPLKEVAGINSYGYVDGNPLFFSDPFGLSPVGDRSRDRPGRERGRSSSAQRSISSLLQGYRPDLTDDEKEFCRKERRVCSELCAEAMDNPDSCNVYGGSIETCIRGCLPYICGGNRIN